VNTVQKVDVAQWVDELLFLYTNIRLRHQRNKVPSYLRGDYNGGLLGDCSKLLRLRNIDVHTREGFSATEWQYASFDSEYMIQIDR
jgi:hypothetical protein